MKIFWGIYSGTHGLMTTSQYASKIPLIDCNTPLYDCKLPQLACNISLPICNIPLNDWTIPLYDSKSCNARVLGLWTRRALARPRKSLSIALREVFSVQAGKFPAQFLSNVLIHGNVVGANKRIVNNTIRTR